MSANTAIGVERARAAKRFLPDADPTSGTVEFLDALGNVIGTLSFTGIDAGIACFTPGTQVATPSGPRAIERLQPGDLVMTHDRGYQPIRWVGVKSFGTHDLQANAALQPILIRKDALGAGLPERDMKVSRQHCLLQSGSRAELYFGEDEVFVRALHMAGQPGIVEAVVQEVTYLHLMFVGLAGQMLIWFELSEEPSIWWATLTSAVWLVLVMRKG